MSKQYKFFRNNTDCLSYIITEMLDTLQDDYRNACECEDTETAEELKMKIDDITKFSNTLFSYDMLSDDKLERFVWAG